MNIKELREQGSTVGASGRRSMQQGIGVEIPYSPAKSNRTPPFIYARAKLKILEIQMRLQKDARKYLMN